MLVLSRKVRESLVIGERVKITIFRISGGRVQLGIEAPSNTRILRAELAEEPATELPPNRRCAEPGRRTTGQ
jgi:carbon storage regulator